MDSLHIINSEKVERLEAVKELPEDGVVWLNFNRETDVNWVDDVQILTGVSIHERHVHDSLSLSHPSFYDSTDAYEMLIFRGLGVDSEEDDFSSRPTVLKQVMRWEI